ncbi:MAG: antirestriction protein ArdA [Alphaproteobacteria bacterium]|nr:antirestriction protein ArdA [Alphaproteobacteria bacterium]
MYYRDCANEADVAARFIDETGGVEELGRDTLEHYFDYDAYARDMKYDMTMIEYGTGSLVKFQ